MNKSLEKRSILAFTRISVVLFVAALVFAPSAQAQASSSDAPSIRSNPSSAGQPSSSPQSSGENSFAADMSVPGTPTLVSPANGATGVSTSPALKVTLSDPNSASLTATFYGRQAPGTGPADFTVIALPDTQKYSSLNNGIFNTQTQWIVNNRASLNIAFVTHLGDIVDDWNVPYEWDVANAALTILDNNGIPYGLVVGNVDENSYGANPAGPDLFNNYFPTSRYQGRPYYGGAYNGDNHNSYQLFSASGLDFIIIHLQYYDPNPDPAIITWAHNLLQTYSNRRGILVTHFITDTSDNFGAQSSAIYQALKDRPNLFLMLGGHLMFEGRRQDPGTDGHTINSLRADFQEPYGNTNPLWANGGNGWLRIMRFSPIDNKIYVQTYSPYLNQYLTDAQSQFTLDYAMGGSSFTQIGTVSNVPSGSTASLTWQNLTPGTQYQWYVSTTNGTSTTIGPTWSFTAGSAGTPPTITTQPASQTVNAGQTAAFTAAAAGSPAPTVQWQVSTNGGGTWTDLSGAASTTYSFTAQAADNGKQYHAVFSNSAGSATSSAAVLTVNYAPAFTSAASTQFAVGSPGSFTAAASGNPAPTLAVSGALPTGVQFNPLSGILSGTPAAGTGGVYALTFTATNTAGTANQNFTLTVNQSPAVTLQPANQSVNANQTASFTAAASGYPAPAVQWQVSANNGATWANISGATSTTYSFTAQSADDGKQFRAVFTNAAGSITSSAATLSVASAPVITAQPANQTVTAGGTASFTAAASGSPSPAVQWQLSLDNGSTWGNIGSATTTTYSFTAQASDSGKQYRAVFTNPAGSATTSAARLTVNVPPAFTSGSSTTFQVGASSSFTVSASGSPAPALNEGGVLPNGITFLDHGNGTAALGGTPAAGTGKTYNLTITAANTAGTAAQSFTLTVNEAPGITGQPSNQSVNTGQPASFTASASGYPTPTAQWQSSTDFGSTWTDISGATSTTYSFTSQAADNGKQFRVIFTNSAGSATSSAAILTVTWAPAITAQPANLVVTAGQTASFSAAATGSPTPTVQWQVSTNNGSTWTNLPGATATTYSFTAQSTDDGKQYHAVFSNSAGTATSSAAVLTVNYPPAFTSTTSTYFMVGSPGSFTVAASGNPAPTLAVSGVIPTGIQFNASTGILNGTPAAGTGGVYALTFTATNPADTATQNFTLTINQPPAVTLEPANLVVAAGQTASFTVAASGYPIPTVQWQSSTDNGATWADISGATSTTYSFTARTTDNGKQYQAAFTNSAGTTTTTAAALSVNGLPVIVAEPADQTLTAGGIASFTAAAAGNPTPTVQWQVSLDNGTTWTPISGATATTYSFTAQVSDTGKQFRAIFTNPAGSATSNAAHLTVYEAPTITSASSTTFLAGSAGSFTVTASGAPAPALNESGVLPAGITFTDHGNGTATLGGTPAAGTGGVYNLTFTVTNAANTATQSFTLTINQALAITTQPGSQSVNANQPASFTAAASGYPSPTVQWQVSTDNGATWVDISGAALTTYSFTAQIADNGKQYRAVFTNSLGSATSSAAALTVTSAPVITTQPVNQTVPPGGTAAFTAAATGSPAPTAQWQLSTDNGSTWTDISGATSATYSFTTQAGDNGKRFRAVFTNSAGSVTSSAAALSITDLIFADGFGSCGASAWLGPNSAALPAFSTSAGNPGCGMAAAFNTSLTAVYLTDPSPNSESVYKARFYFNPNTMKLSKNDTVTIFTASQGSSTPVLAVQVHSNNGKSLIIRAGATNDSGGWSYTPWTNIPVKWQAVEVDWQASSSATANNGSLQFLLSGTQVGSLANLNNDARRVDTVSMGIISGMTRTTTGTGYFDEFISRRYTTIGM